MLFFQVRRVVVQACKEDPADDTEDGESAESIHDTPAGAVVAVSNHLGSPTNGLQIAESDEYTLCGAHSGYLAGGSQFEINCPQNIMTSHVFVYLPRVDSLRILNVRVIVTKPDDDGETNEAENGEGDATSTEEGDPDDVTDNSNDVCFATKQSHFPWWRVVLPQEQEIIRVRLTACKDDEEDDGVHDPTDEPIDDTPAGFAISVATHKERPADGTDLEGTDFIHCGAHSGKLEPGGSATVLCPGMPVATVIYVYLPRTDALRVKNIEVFVVKPDEETTPNPDGNNASDNGDGDSSTTEEGDPDAVLDPSNDQCFVTEASENPWWSVKLEQTSKV